MPMNRDQFWLTEPQFSKISPHLPTDTRGKPRVDNLRIISGIIHVLKSGCRWGDALRQQRHSPSGRGSRRNAEHSAQGEPQVEKLLFPVPLSQPQRYRAQFL
jgi:transposase